METKVSTEGQVALPHQTLHRLGIHAGDPLDVSVDAGRIVPTPLRPQSCEACVVIAPNTGFPVIDLGPNAPVLTSEQVAEMLAEFP